MTAASADVADGFRFALPYARSLRQQIQGPDFSLHRKGYMDRRDFLKLAGAAIPGLAASHTLAGSAVSPARERFYTPRYPKFGPDPDPSLRPAPVTRRLMVIILNPRVTSRGNVSLTTLFNWANPDRIIDTHIKELRHASYGYVNYQIVERHLVEDWGRWPPYKDGFRYNEQSYLADWNARTPHHPHYIDYNALIAEFGMAEKVASGHVDEVWHIGPPYDAKWEAVMAGPGASNSNASPIGGTDHAGRRFVIMGYNFERSPVEMLHSYSHRAEGHLRTVFSRFGDNDNLWKRFIRYDLTHPGMAECGNVHFPPNGVQDYDYFNKRVVLSNSDDWYHFPYLNGNRFRPMNDSEWTVGGRDMYLLWWLRHLPHVAGSCDGVALNWWQYMVDPNTI